MPETGIYATATAELHMPNLANPADVDLHEFMDALHKLVHNRLSVDGDVLVVRLVLTLRDGSTL